MRNPAVLKLFGVAFLCLMPIIFTIIYFNINIFTSYEITNFEVDAKMSNNGDVLVNQTMNYVFNSKSSSVDIRINKDKSIYNDNVNIYTVDNKGQVIQFTSMSNVFNSTKNTYTEKVTGKYTDYTLHFPESSEPKKIIIKYTMPNVINRYLDCSELYWDILGSNYKSKIKNIDVNIDIENKDSLKDLTKIYVHGPKGSVIKVDNNSNIKIHYDSLKPYQTIAPRVIVDRNAVTSSNFFNRNGLPEIINNENELNKLIASNVITNGVVIILIIAILIYWILLIIKYQYNKYMKVYYADDMELMNKYNPIIAACIAQKRDMQPRDIIAILIDLVNREILKMECVKVVYNTDEKLIYKIRKNEVFFDDKEKIKSLDVIENRVIEMFFDNEENEYIELEKQVNKINKQSVLMLRVKLLNKIVRQKLIELGSNIVKVPENIIRFNNLLFIIICVVIFINFLYNNHIAKVTLVDSTIKLFNVIYSVFLLGILATPILLFVGYLLLCLFAAISRQLEKIIFKITPSKVDQVIVFNIILTVVITLVQIFMGAKIYTILNTLLFTLTLCLITTDNLLASHSTRIMKTYLCLKSLEDKLKNGSLLKDKEIKDYVLWNKYLVYAVAFGISNVEEYSKLLDTDGSKIVQQITNDSLLDLNNYISFSEDVTSAYTTIITSMADIDFDEWFGKYRNIT